MSHKSSTFDKGDTGSSNNNNQKKRCSPSEINLFNSKAKKICITNKEDLENMDTQKHANFSSTAPNGIRNPSINKKHGMEKKVLAIKNFKGK